jgi:ubiquinone/menaquinone biosynthesis C-methylase UbiE
LKPEEFDKMFLMEKNHWWFFSKRRFVKLLMEKYVIKQKDLTILDAGCGTGVMLSELSSYGKAIGFDISDGAIKNCKKRDISNVNLARAEKLPFKDGTFDLIVALDVIEHLDSDLLALREFKRICKKDGFLLITVPAFKFLWSTHDEVLDHKRRYTREELDGKLRSSGFRVIRSTYLYFILFPFITVAKVSDRWFRKRAETEIGEFSRPVNDFMKKLLSVEAFLIKRVNFPFGSSVLSLAKREN